MFKDNADVLTMKKMFGTIRIIWILLVAALLVPFAEGIIDGHFIEIYRLTFQGVQSVAEIVEVRPREDGYFRYVVDVHGHKYYGWGALQQIDRPFVGDKVGITYFADDPNVSRFGYLEKEAFFEYWWGLAVYSLVLLFPIVLFVYADLKQRTKSKPSDSVSTKPSS
jgi:hypothetical protein